MDSDRQDRIDARRAARLAATAAPSAAPRSAPGPRASQPGRGTTARVIEPGRGTRIQDGSLTLGQVGTLLPPTSYSTLTQTCVRFVPPPGGADGSGRKRRYNLGDVVALRFVLSTQRGRGKALLSDECRSALVTAIRDAPYGTPTVTAHVGPVTLSTAPAWVTAGELLAAGITTVTVPDA